MAVPYYSMMRDLDGQVLEVLTHHLRFMGTRQIARAWWDSRPPHEATQRLRHLTQRGWLRSLTLPLVPELSLATPLFAWEPGQPPPHFGALAYEARRRATTTSPEITQLFCATPQAARAFGGRPGSFKLDCLHHDLNVAALYVKLRTQSPEDAENWVGEDALVSDKGGDVCPDVELHDVRGRVYYIHEIAGSSYKAERFERLHDDGAFRAIPYSIW